MRSSDPIAEIEKAKTFDPISEADLVETDHWLRSICLAAKPGTRTSKVDAFRIGDHAEIANHLFQALDREKVCYDMGELYRYRSDGVWTPIPIDFLEAIVADLSGCPVWAEKGTRPLSISHGVAKDAARLLCKLVKAEQKNRVFDPPVSPAGRSRYGIGFDNGFLTIVDGVAKLLPHSPDNLCRFAFDFSYAPDVPHPLLDRFFDVVFRGEDALSRQRLPMLLQEFVGACLFGEATNYECILVLSGAGGNGKSEFLNIIRAVFPPGSTTALPPQTWGVQYAVLALAGKLANFVDEVDDKEISVGSVFKKIVSGQPTHVDRKFLDSVLFSPRCGHIFNVNRLFGTSDTTDGFYRRIKIVPFDHRPLPHEREVKIGERIARQERRALVSWAVRGYLRLKAQGAYTDVARVAQKTTVWQIEADNVRMFLCAVYESHKDAPRISVDDLFKMYRSWCEKTGSMKLTLHKFSRRCRETNMMTDAKDRFGAGLAWSHGTVKELLGLMGDDAPEWGTVEAAGSGTYSKAGTF